VQLVGIKYIEMLSFIFRDITLSCSQLLRLVPVINIHTTQYSITNNTARFCSHSS